MSTFTLSMVANAGTTGTRDTGATKVVYGVRNGRWRTQVEHIRQVYADAFAATHNHKEAKQAVSD